MTDSQMNGPIEGEQKFIDTIDPEDPAYIKNLQRPVEIKEDICMMDSRKRVSLILNSEAFRQELEQIVEDQLRQGPSPASVVALQQLSELLNPRGRNRGAAAGVSSMVMPIADIRGVDSVNYSKGEKILRCKVASLYRLVDMFGWSEGIYNHISMRLNQDQEHFLINPFGMLYNEITASSLVKIDMQGEVVDQGSSVLGVNKAGFMVHGAIHAARPDIRCVVHLHTPAAVAVSAMKCGLLPLCVEAAILGNVSYHDYGGIIVTNEEKDKLARNLGPNNKILILRNHGVCVCGSTVEEAFHKTFLFMQAAELQMRLAPMGVDNLIQIDTEAAQQAHEVGSRSAGGVNMVGGGQEEVKWKPGELEFEALMRFLDNAGFKTGHIYRQPMIRRARPAKDRATSDVEIPPTSSSFIAGEDNKENTPMKTAMLKQQKKTWLNSPSTYTKQEIDEVGTDSPKKITKWVVDEQGERQLLYTEDPNFFSPQGDNPKELKQKTKEIKKGYYENKKSAGPQSKVLEGMTWDEAAMSQEGQRSGTTETVVVVGAVSKGIIKRDHQHNVAVYKQTYASNPFDSMSQEEVDAYKEDIERKQKGDAEPEVEVEAPPSPVANDGSPAAVNGDGDELPASPAKSDTMRSTDSGELLEDSREGSPVKEASTESPSKGGDKHKKKKFRMPSFSKKKKEKESKKKQPAKESGV